MHTLDIIYITPNYLFISSIYLSIQIIIGILDFLNFVFAYKKVLLLLLNFKLIIRNFFSR